MSNTTDVYWDVDGVPLQTHAYNVTSVGAKWSTPKLRGEDRKYAFRHGSAHRPRVADSRGVTLGLWVIGQTVDGAVPASREIQFNAHMRALRTLFFKADGTEFVLTKRWREAAGIVTASARGIVQGGIGPEMEGGPYRAKFVADVLLADPFFYGVEVVVPVALGAPVTVVNPGDDTSWETSIEFIGQLSNPKLTNLTPEPDVYVKVGTAIAAGDKVTVDCDETTVKRQNDGANLIGALVHSGARQWFGLRKGTNSIQLSADSGAGSAVLRYKPVYF